MTHVLVPYRAADAPPPPRSPLPLRTRLWHWLFRRFSQRPNVRWGRFSQDKPIWCHAVPVALADAPALVAWLEAQPPGQAVWITAPGDYAPYELHPAWLAAVVHDLRAAYAEATYAPASPPDDRIWRPARQLPAGVASTPPKEDP